jgi:hypothetical protein
LAAPIPDEAVFAEIADDAIADTLIGGTACLVGTGRATHRPRAARPRPGVTHGLRSKD